MLSLEVVSSSSGMFAFINRLSNRLDAAKPGTMQSGLHQAAERYLGFTRRRYVSLSKGSGEWPDLALSTKVSRMRSISPAGNKHAGPLMLTYEKLLKKQQKGIKDHRVTRKELAAARHFDILRDTGALLNSLSTGAPGYLEESMPDGIRIGTRVRYARFHQSPSIPGRPPMRRIMVEPDSTTKLAINNILAAAFNKTASEAARA